MNLDIFILYAFTFCCCVGVSKLNANKYNNMGDYFNKTVLVFGGNGFIGSYTVQNMLRANFSVVIINRGNWYWDTADTIKPYVTHLKCDRMQSLQRCSGLQYYLWGMDAPPIIEAVIDFSAYHAFEITEALHILEGRVKKYIYISSDSVYEVCNKTHSGLTREDDAVRPDSKEKHDEYKFKDNYGNRKLECEEELHRQSQKKGGVSYIAFRLPDVIGPRDNTYRWWIYQLWLKLYKYLDRPLSVSVDLWNQPMSLVYVEDVADIIVSCIDGSPKIYNHAYNIALQETPTLVQFLHSLMNALDVEDIDILKSTQDDKLNLFPSVNNGALDITKAKLMLNWNPSSWIDVLDTTSAFYESAMLDSRFSNARNEIIQIMQQHYSNDPLKVIRGIKEIYGLTLDTQHDEL